MKQMTTMTGTYFDRVKGRERTTEYPPTNSSVTKPLQMTGRPVAREMLEGSGRRGYQRGSLLLPSPCNKATQAGQGERSTDATVRSNSEQDGKGESTRDDASCLATGHRKAYCTGCIHVKDVGIGKPQS